MTLFAAPVRDAVHEYRAEREAARAAARAAKEIEEIRAWFGSALPRTAAGAVGRTIGRPAQVADYLDLVGGTAAIAVGWVQRATSGLRWICQDDDGKEQAGAAVTAALAGLVRRRGRVLSEAIRDVSLVGNAFFERRRDGMLRYLPFHLVRDLEDAKTRDLLADEMVGVEVRTGPSGSRRIPRDRLLHVRHGTDPRRPAWGISPLAGVVDDLVSDQQASRTTAAVLRNVARIGLIVRPAPDTGEWDHQTVRQFTRMLREQFSRADAGGELVSSVKADFLSPRMAGLDDLAMSEVRSIVEARICAALGLQPSTIGFSAGISQTKVGATQSTNLRSTWQSGVIPLLRQIAEQIGDQLLPDFGLDADRFHLGHDLGPVRITWETPEEMTVRLVTLVEHEVITAQEARARLERAGHI